jgi:hypothetical protein
MSVAYRITVQEPPSGGADLGEKRAIDLHRRTPRRKLAENKRRLQRRACADPNALQPRSVRVVNFAALLIITDLPAISMALIGAAH